MKSGYKLICEDSRSEEASGSTRNGVSGLWYGIWKLKVPGKIKHFLWKACANSLPTKVNLMKLKILADPLCHLCGRILEDHKHALWDCDCEAVKSVWCKDFTWVNQFEATHVTFLDLVDRLISKPRVTELFATTACFIWTHRNKTKLMEKSLPLGSIAEAAKKFLQQFRSCQEEHSRGRQIQRCKCCHQNQVIIKANFEGAMFSESDEAGIGIVVRDSTTYKSGSSSNGWKNLKTI